MKNVIISDIHFGNGQGFDIYAGGDALLAFLDRFIGDEYRVIIAGDSVDFLMNEDPLEMTVERSVEQATAIAEHPDTRAAFAALGKILAAGGQVVVRLGNHDIELALPEVQQVFRDALGQPASVAARLEYQLGNTPWVLQENGAKVLIAHGEHNDPWNRINYHQLLDGEGIGDVTKFDYPPGSRLVKTLMNPLKRQYKMRFSDLLKPDFQGAVLTALAVDPSAVKTIFKGSTAKLLWQLFKRKGGPSSFAPGEEEADLGLNERVDEAGLTGEEQRALRGLLDDDALVSFDADPSVLNRALVKMGKTGLKLYARLHKALADDSGDTYFELQPSDDEWKEAHRLADKFGAQAVVLGHTHAARFRGEADLTFVNTGTWIWLMSLPQHTAGDDEWVNFLTMLRQNPGLDPAEGDAPPLQARFTAATLQPLDRPGARLSLVEWTADGAVEVLGARDLGPATE